MELNMPTVNINSLNVLIFKILTCTCIIDNTQPSSKHQLDQTAEELRESDSSSMPVQWQGKG